MKPTGIYVAAVTPRTSGTVSIDTDAALAMIDWLVDHGVQGLVLMGSTGEFVHYSIEQRIEYAKTVVKHSRVPVLVNVSHSSYRGAMELANAARDMGAAGSVLMPPYFFRYSQTQLFEFYTRFGDEFRDAPLYMYNIPFFTTPLDVSTARLLLETGRFSGIKDSSGNIDYLSQLLPYRGPETAVFVGNDVVFHSLRAAGADGVVSGVSCALPELMLGIDRAIAADDHKNGERLDVHLQEYIRQIDSFPAPIGVKESVALRGLTATGHSIPLGPQTQKEIEKFRHWFREWLPVVLEDCKRV
jgi:dihydrodipicolinate synthase/N-acetylneuraminate lyase